MRAAFKGLRKHFAVLDNFKLQSIFYDVISIILKYSKYDNMCKKTASYLH